jgi:hypothetical protein
VVAVPPLLVGPQVPLAARPAGGAVSAANAPATISVSVMEHMPSRRLLYAPVPHAARGKARPAAIPPGYGCELQAYDTEQLHGEVYGHGFNHCAHGLLMKSQVCIYKLHHILFFPDWRKEKCEPANFGTEDLPPAFRPLSVSRGCRSGKGNWYTLMFGSDELRPGPGGTRTDSVRSEHQAKVCN